MSNTIKKDFFENLPEDVKNKLKDCKSEEEAMNILKANMIEMPDEMLDDAAGGRYTWQDDWYSHRYQTGDSRNDLPTNKTLAKDFEEGRITGADFF